MTLSGTIRLQAGLILTLVVTLVGCNQGVPVPVTRASEPVEPEQPAPAPTAIGPAGSTGRFEIYTGDRALSGEPPFTAALIAGVSYDLAQEIAACRAVEWTFGDGAEEIHDCPTLSSSRFYWTTEHGYERPGTYHARVQMVLAGGRAIESEKTQTVVVAERQRPTLRAVFVRWLAWAGLLTTIGLTAIWLAFQRGRRRLLGASLLFLFLITFVPPFSYAPDPLGVILAVTGGYRYDPRLPLANRFLVAGDPTATLRPFLDGLVGQTGLDPLDPAAPLARYEFVKVVRRQYQTDVHVRFAYSDGAERTYSVPLSHPSSLFGFYAHDWRYDGLGRLRTEHRALPPVPLGGTDTITPGTPQRLRLAAIDAENGQDWLGASKNPLNRRLLWSPEGDAFLAPARAGAVTTLWLLSPEDGSARRIADSVWSYGWLPDGSTILYSTVEQSRYIGPDGPARDVYAVSRDGQAQQRLMSLPVGQSWLPGLTEEGLWYTKDGALWFLPLVGGEPVSVGQARRLAPLPGLSGRPPRRPVQVRPAPDGERIAYSCGLALCLMDADGNNHVIAVSDERFVSLAWRGDGQQLAAAFWDYEGPAALRLIGRDGAIVAEWPIAPDGPVDPPQWTPGGERLFLQTFPRNGRRMLAVETGRGRVIDLSRPRWDAFFALHPDGKQLLLNNGRGGFWLSQVD